MLIKDYISQIVNTLGTIKKGLLEEPKLELDFGKLNFINPSSTSILSQLGNLENSVICIATEKRTLDFANEQDKARIEKFFNWIPLCSKDKALCFLLAQSVLYSSPWDITKERRFDVEMSAFFLAAVFAHSSTLDNPTPSGFHQLIDNVPDEKLINILVNSPNEIACYYITLFNSVYEKFGRFFNRLPKEDKERSIFRVWREVRWLEHSKLRKSKSETLKVPDFTRLTEEKFSLYLDLTENYSSRIEITTLTNLLFNLMSYQLKQSKNEQGVYFFVDSAKTVEAIVSSVPREKLIFSLEDLEELCNRYSTNPFTDNSLLKQE